ncbi:MAG: hypothetical protein EOM87_03175 [Clostridia bacterium]|nr:hypothetical protein [Clostridia bacterium]
MKKVLIAILLLIPLLVIMSISVSGMIISAEITINIESMKLTHKGKEVFAEQILLDEYIEKNKKFQLFADYYPRIAQNKSIIWTSSDESVATVNNGIVSFLDYGSVDITATAASNTSCNVSCTFYVIGEAIKSIHVSEYGEDVVKNEYYLKKYQTMPLKAEIIPSTALGDNKIEWSSNNESIVNVDNNGILTAVSIGAATVTVSAKGIKGVYITKTINITVESEMLSIIDTVYTSATSFNFADILSSPDVLVYVNNQLIVSKIYNITNIGITEVELRKNGHSEYINLVQKATDKALVFENIFAMQKGAWLANNYISQGGADIILKAVAAEGSLPAGAEIIWTSNDQQVVRVINGRLYGHTPGNALITASFDGYESAEIEVTVAMPISYIRLEYDTKEDKPGLGQDRVFGIYTCQDKVVTNQLKLNIKSTYPDVLTMIGYEELFDYSSSNELYATVDAMGIITFSRAAIGKFVTITVEARYSPLIAKDSYTFKVIDGINIGVGYQQNIYDKDNDIMPSFVPFNDLMYIANEYQGDYQENNEVSAIVLHTNIYYPENLDGEHQVNLSRSIYGNGNKLDGQMHSRTFTTRMFGSTTNGLFNSKRPLEIVVENLSIQSFAPISEDSVAAFRELANKGGMPWYKYASNEHLEGITHIFRYCLFQYAYSQMELSGGKTVIEGCIFRNTAGPAILMQTSKDTASDLTIKNCIFSNSIAPAMITTCGEFMSDKNTRDGTKYFTLRMEGENYIYNWKKLDETFRLDVIPTNNIAYTDKLALYDTLNNNMADWIKLALKDERNSDLIYENLKGDYINFGFLLLPLWVPNNALFNPSAEHYYNGGISVIGDASKYMLKELIVDTTLTSNPIVKGAMNYFGIRIADSPLNLVLPKGNKDGYNTMPDEKYELNAATLAKLHGTAQD